MLNAIRERGTIDELKRIAKRNKGILVAEDVVEEARPCDNLLHKYFEWDDTEAARKWRLVQARNLINVCVEIIPNTNDKESRIFVSLTTDRNNDRGWRVSRYCQRVVES